MKKKLKAIPKFKSEAEERQFWQSHDSTEYVDWGKAKVIDFTKIRRGGVPIDEVLKRC
jgi:hypothetical protein